jgi:two-component system phosphate regulon response regulator PhoB
VQQQAKVVAVLAATPALTSILAAVLRMSTMLRVRQFESLLALQTYMRLTGVDMVVCDFDGEDAPAGEVSRALRADETVAQRNFQVIALASDVTAATKTASLACGVTEVIVKPMSPKYLLERVQSRLRVVETAEYFGIDRRREPELQAVPYASYADRGGNVVELFPR